MNNLSIINQIKNSDITVIVGPPCAGKSTYTSAFENPNNLLHLPSHRVFHTDDYIPFGFKDALYKMMDDIAAHKGKMIIEGIQTARLLRKGVELGTFKPDLIIKFEIDQHTLEVRYAEREGKGKAYPFSTAKSIQTVWGEYAAEVAKMEEQPTIHIVTE